MAQINEYEEFLKEYMEESAPEEEEGEDGPPGLQLDGVPFKNFTPKIKERIGMLPLYSFINKYNRKIGTSG